MAELIAQGCSSREIAARLVITEGTATNHVTHILNKLGLRSRTQIAVWASASRRGHPGPRRPLPGPPECERRRRMWIPQMAPGPAPRSLRPSLPGAAADDGDGDG